MRLARAAVVMACSVGLAGACSSFGGVAVDPEEAGVDGVAPIDATVEADHDARRPGADAQADGADARRADASDAGHDAKACGLLDQPCSDTPDTCCAGYLCNAGICLTL